MKGPQTFKLLQNLITLEKPGDNTYAELVEVLTDYFSPTQSEIVQRSIFGAHYFMEWTGPGVSLRISRNVVAALLGCFISISCNNSSTVKQQP